MAEPGNNESQEGQEGGTGEAGVELTESELHMIQEVRSRRLPPEEVVSRATRDRGREQADQTQREADAGAQDPNHIPTRAEVQKMMQETSQQISAAGRQDASRKEIQSIVRGRIDAAADFKDAPDWKKNQLEVMAAENLRQRTDLASMSPAEFNAALSKATDEAVDEERKFSTGAGAKEQQDEAAHRLKVQREAGGGEAPPEPGESDRRQEPPDRVGADGRNMRFGAFEQDWSVTDQEIQMDLEEARVKELRKAGVVA